MGDDLFVDSVSEHLRDSREVAIDRGCLQALRSQVVSKRMDVLGQVVGDGPGGVVGESDRSLELRKAAFTVCRLPRDE